MKAPACPICRKPAVAAFRPFCSGDCADTDLQRWLKGSYVVPASEGDEGDLEEGEQEP